MVQGMLGERGRQQENTGEGDVDRGLSEIESRKKEAM